MEDCGWWYNMDNKAWMGKIELKVYNFWSASSAFIRRNISLSKWSTTKYSLALSEGTKTAPQIIDSNGMNIEDVLGRALTRVSWKSQSKRCPKRANVYGCTSANLKVPNVEIWQVNMNRRQTNTILSAVCWMSAVSKRRLPKNDGLHCRWSDISPQSTVDL